MGNFISGLVGLMSNLVQGWTALGDNARADLGRQFANFSDGLMTGESSPTAPVARPTRASTREKKGACSGVRDAGTSSNANVDDEPNIGSKGIRSGGSRPVAPAARCTRASTCLNKGAHSGVLDVGTSSNVNIEDEPILVSDSTSSEDAQPDALDF
jgi:hypothetical protein